MKRPTVMTMTRHLIASIILSLLLITAFASTGFAQVQNKRFGLGLVLGSPTGITGKFWNSQRRAWSGGAAWSLKADESLHLYLDHHWHDFNLLNEPRTAVYYGVGGRLAFSNGPDNSRFGVRIPFGINYLFPNDPIDVFLEIVPVFDVVPETRLDVLGGIGARYYFNPSGRS